MAKKTLLVSLPCFPLLFFLASMAAAMATIEPCTGTTSCQALLGYTLYTYLKVSEVAALFQADPFALLAANAIDPSLPGVENRILPAGLFLHVPAICSCASDIHRFLSTCYTVCPADTLAAIATSVFAG